ncbi:MAG: bile acid:sodium symporter family protein [Erythrobacter sp.]|uniref:bile acid:sodium symporter family protein n=1 Tax=Erythrobacter sp. TaxID=1042 RepID=UPI0032997A62
MPLYADQKPMLSIENLTPIALALMMVGMGLALKQADFEKLLSAPGPVIIGVLAQMVGLPVLGFTIAVLSGVSPTMAVGIMILVSCAGGVVSGLLTQLAEGDVALSISMTSISMLIGAISIPIVINESLQYFLNQDDYVEMDLLETSLRLISMTILPVILGMLMRYKFPSFADRFHPMIARGSNILLALIIVMTIAVSGDGMTNDLPALVIPLFLLNGLAMLLGYGSAMAVSWKIKTAKTLAIEVGIQNSATGIFVATSLLGNLQFAIPSMIYTGVAFVNVALFIYAFGNRSHNARTT